MALRQRLGFGLALAVAMTAGYLARPYVDTVVPRSVHLVSSDMNTTRFESADANLIRMSFQGSVIEAERIDVIQSSGFFVIGGKIGGKEEPGAVPAQ